MKTHFSISLPFRLALHWVITSSTIRWAGRCGATLLLAFGLAHPACADATQPPAWQQTAGVFHTTLPNGFALWVRPDHRAPTAVHMLWVRVGSMDEVDGTSGVAHVLEHMLFKGTPTVAPGEYSRRIAALGGRDNAFTSRDATVYHQQVPAVQLEAVMALEADRFAHNQWPDDEFRRELEVVKEERRQRTDGQPTAQLWEALNAATWQAHPYRRPIIGWMEDLNTLTPDEARAFFRQWYVPANAAIVVAGDVEPDQVLALALKHYGAIPARAVPSRKTSAEPPQLGQRTVQVKAASEKPVVAMSYQAPRLASEEGATAYHVDALALMLLGTVLDGYEGARLGRTLVQPIGGQRLADQVDAGYSGSGRGPAQFVLTATPAAGKTVPELVQALQSQLAQVMENGVTEAELARAKNQWRSSEVYRLDALFAQARQAGDQWLNGLQPDAQARLLAQLQTITPAQVQLAAQRTFVTDRLTLAELVPDAQALAARQQAVAHRPKLNVRH